MKKRNIFGTVASIALVASSLVVGASSAMATTSEECVPVAGVEAWVETIPAVTEEVKHDAVEPKAAVYEIEYEFAHKKDGKKTKWSTNPNWNAENNENSQGWHATGNTRNGKLISEEVPGKDAWVETIVVTPEQTIQHPAVEAVTCDDEVPPVVTPVTKTLKWTLPEGGTWPQEVFTEESIPCGTTVTVQVDTYPYTTDEDKARTDALDDDGFLLEGEDYGWAQSWYFEEYTAPQCEVTPLPANPNAEITAVCGKATLLLTNPLINDANQVTASFVVNVDGVYYNAYSAEAGARVEDSITFAEDTGNHLIEVYQAGTSEWKLIQSATVTSDCVVPPVVVPPVVEPPVVEPPVVEPPVVVPPVVEPPVVVPPVVEPPVVVPPVVEPPVVEPPVTETPVVDVPTKTIVTQQRAAVQAPAELAETGVEPAVIGGGIVAFIVLSGFGAWLLVAGGKKREELAK